MSAALGEKDDKELAVLASKHNKEAFNILVERHEEYMMAVSQRYTDTYHEAQDIFQKACLKAWKAFPNFRQDCHFKTWVYRVVRSAAYDHNAWKKEEQKFLLNLFLPVHPVPLVAPPREVIQKLPKMRLIRPPYLAKETQPQRNGVQHYLKWLSKKQANQIRH